VIFELVFELALAPPALMGYLLKDITSRLGAIMKIHQLLSVSALIFSLGASVAWADQYGNLTSCPVYSFNDPRPLNPQTACDCDSRYASLKYPRVNASKNHMVNILNGLPYYYNNSTTAGTTNGVSNQTLDKNKARFCCSLLQEALNNNITDITDKTTKDEAESVLRTNCPHPIPLS
jgi:hypothetical protein